MRDQRGQSLIEVMLAILLFAMLGTGLISVLLTSVQASKQGNEHSVALGYIQEGIEAVRNMRDRNWSLVTLGTHGLSTAGNTYLFSGVSDSLGLFTRTTTIERVYRTGGFTGNIAATGIPDGSTKKVTVNISWDTLTGRSQHVDGVFYVTNFGTKQSWTQTLAAEFAAGKLNSTSMTSTGDGEIVLGVHDLTWSPLQSAYAFDLAGTGARIASLSDDASDVMYLLASNTVGQDVESYDISDVSESIPVRLDGYDISDATDLALSHPYLFVSANENGPGAEVVVLDTRNMSLITTINLPSTMQANTLTVVGSVLIIGRQNGVASEELFFYDITDPTLPTLLGSTEIGAAIFDMVSDGTYVYLAIDANAAEITTVRISDRVVVDTFDAPTNADAVSLSLFGTTLFMGRTSGSAEELYTLDVSDPVGTGLTQIDSLEIGIAVNAIDIDPTGTSVILATDDVAGEIKILDLATLTLGNTFNLNSDARTVQIRGAFAYIGTEDGGREWEILRVTEGGWVSPTQVAIVNAPTNSNEAVSIIDGVYLYLATENNGASSDLFIYDITTPTAPVLLGSMDTNEDIFDLAISGNTLYLATSDNARELDVINVTTKTSPTRIGSYNAAGNANGFSVATSGTNVYLGRDQSAQPEFFVIDVTTPAVPVFLGSRETSGDLNDLGVSGTSVFAATADNAKELIVFNVAVPALPTEAGAYNAAGGGDATSVDISGTTLSLGRLFSGDPEVCLLDISTPATPSAVGLIEIADDVNGVALDGTTAVFLATDVNGQEMQRWDITIPATPTNVATFNLGADTNMIDTDGVYVYASTRDNAAEVYLIGQGTAGTDVSPEGTMTSMAFDSGIDATWTKIEWTQSGVGTIEFRLRSAPTEALLSSATWVGSDGTHGSTYTISGEDIVLDPLASGTRWIQWKAFLVGNGTQTPQLEDVTLTYE